MSDGCRSSQAHAAQRTSQAKKEQDAVKIALADFAKECADWIDELEKQVTKQGAEAESVQECDSETDETVWEPEAATFARCVVLSTNQPINTEKVCMLNNIYAAESKVLNHEHRSAIVSMSSDEERASGASQRGAASIEQFQHIHRLVTSRTDRINNSLRLVRTRPITGALAGPNSFAQALLDDFYDSYRRPNFAGILMLTRACRIPFSTLMQWLNTTYKADYQEFRAETKLKNRLQKLNERIKAAMFPNRE